MGSTLISELVFLSLMIFFSCEKNSREFGAQFGWVVVHLAHYYIGESTIGEVS